MSARFARAASVAGALALVLAAACSDAPTVVPPRAVASVQVSPPATSLVIGETVTLQARPKALNGDDLPDRAVTWSSENNALATVSAAGVVTTLGVGQVAIHATSEGRVGQAVLTITPIAPVPVAEVRISAAAEVQLAWNGTAQITAVALDAQGNVLPGRGPALWQSNRPSVVTVADGLLTAVSPGLATISATIEGVVSNAGVRVLQAPVTEVIVEGPTGLEVGEIAGFAGRVSRANGWTGYEPVMWTSSAPDIATVTSEDLWGATIEAKAEGVVTITAIRDGVSSARTLRVTPRVSADLLYHRSAQGTSEIFTLGTAVDGYSPIKLNAGNVSREPSPSPDGTQVVFAVSQQMLGSGEWQHDLYIVNRNGMNMRWLTRTAGVEERPRWSPTGSKILFRGTSDARADLFTINPDGTGTENLTAGLTTMTDIREASWSPDGSRVVFIGVVGGQHKVWTMRADGTDLRQVTTDAGFDMSPAYSPDGSTIAFVRYNNAVTANGNDVMIIAATGGMPTRLALRGDQMSPAWSPDGHYIAVSGTAVAGQGQVEIYTLRPDGTGLRLRTINPAWGGGSNPVWIARP